MKLLSRSDELVLLAILYLGDKAYGVAIRQYLSRVTDEEWSIGAVYVPLDRLEKQGAITSTQAPPTPERGGRSKRYYCVTDAGLKALHALRQVNKTLWTNIPTPELGYR